MQLIITSDWHLHPWREFATIIDTPEFGPCNNRLYDGYRLGKAIGSYAQEHSIKHVVHGGDLVHKQGAAPTEAYTVGAYIFREWRDVYGIRDIVFDDGNHDHADRAGNFHALQVLGESRLVHIAARGRGYRLYLHKTFGVPLITFSYCDDAKLLEQRVDRVSKMVMQGEAIAVFHHGFKGARVGSILEYQVREPLDAAALGLGERFRKVFSGHYHANQAIRGCAGGVYIGSPMELTRSDSDEIADYKGFLVYDTQTGLSKFVRFEAPRFVTLDQQSLTRTHFEMDAPGNFVTVEYSEYKGGAEKLRADLIEAGAKGVKLVPQAAVEAARATVRMRVDASPDKALRRVVKAKTGKLDARLLKTGRELYAEANQKEED